MPPSRPTTVFRVRGLSAAERDKAEDSLRAAIDEHLSDKDRQTIETQITIVPSCDDEETLVALVDFRGGIPDFLSDLTAKPLGDTQVEMKDGDDISFDRHFHGFTQLYDTKANSAITADIIAISGIDGHAYGSWRGKGNLGRMWLRDFLSKDMPYCRTMIYGYNAKLLSSGIDTILDYSRGFLEEIKNIRRSTEERMRPLFFIAHSFGGLLLARCLVRAAQANEEDEPIASSIYRATYGILFFAVPHKGMMTEDMLSMLGQHDHPRADLLAQIDRSSKYLISQLADFKDLIRDRKIVTFYETQHTRKLQQDPENGAWARTGPYITALDTESALLQLPIQIETPVKLDADHSMLVKFDSKTAYGYKTALNYLRAFEKEAPEVVRARFSKQHNIAVPSSTVPFARDLKFIGRDDIIAKLDSIFAKPHAQSRAALIGLGGIGKSQIAIEYSYRLRNRIPGKWVFWVHASNAARVEMAYRDIATKVDLPGRDDPEANILRLVLDWLSDEQNGTWFMILDNADNSNIFFDRHTSNLEYGSDSAHSPPRLINFIPQVQHGAILVTSRNRSAAHALVEDYENVIQVDPLDEDKSLDLMKAKLSVDAVMEDDAKNLLKVLEYVPLAITQASAYIRENAPMMTISRYFKEFLRNEANQTTLLNKGAEDLRRDPDMPNAVITTWEISFRQIREQHEPAADMLSLMCLFNRQGIPDFLLQADDDHLAFVSAIAPLINFSLVTAELGGEIFEMHRLVQIATRRWLESDGTIQEWKGKATRKMANSFPNGKYETWATCEVLLPHAEEIIDFDFVEEEIQLQRAEILHNIACDILERGNYDLAMQRFEESLKVRRLCLDREDERVLDSMANLARAFQKQGQWKEAEELEVQVMETRKRVFRAEHPDTLSSIANLASTLSDQGRWKEAEELEVQVLETKKRVLGVEHPETLASIVNLALTFWNQGRWKEAEELEVQVVETRKRVLGAEHPHTLTGMSNLAYTYESEDRSDQAIELMKDVVELRTKTIGANHPATISSTESLREWMRIRNSSTYTVAG